MTDISISRLEASQFTNGELSFSALAGDNPFLSEVWQKIWIRHYVSAVEDNLFLFKVVSPQSACTIFPCYRSIVTRGGLFRTSSLQFIGSDWFGDSAMLSEYLGPVSETVQTTHYVSWLDKILTEKDFGELVLSFTADRELVDCAIACAEKKGVFYRVFEHSPAYQVDLRNGFDDYLHSLSANSRRKVYGQRNKLLAAGSLRIERYGNDDASECLSILSELHERRWGRRVFSEDWIRFHETLARSWDGAGSTSFSVLRLDDAPVSILYDIKFGKKVFNLQMGFDPSALDAASLGLLHLGYEIEHAASEGFEIFDLLAGSGMKTDYKRAISNAQTAMWTVQMVPNDTLASLYRVRNKLRSLFQRPAAGG